MSGLSLGVPPRLEEPNAEFGSGDPIKRQPKKDDGWGVLIVFLLGLAALMGTLAFISWRQLRDENRKAAVRQQLEQERQARELRCLEAMTE